MKVRSLAWLSVAMLLSAAASGTDDWPGWRGPTRNGVVADSPPLVDTFGKEGPKLLWKSQPLLGDDAERFGAGKVTEAGGWGSVSVVGKRAFVCINLNVELPTKTRKIDVRRFKTLQQLSWNLKMPADDLNAIEKARTSPERAALKNARALSRWKNKWLAEHGKHFTNRHRHYASTRLDDGPEGFPLETMRTLLPLLNRVFDDDAALEKWFDANGIDADVRQKLRERRHIQTTRRGGRDVLWCLDVETGKPLWHRAFEGAQMAYACSFTPTVADGRVYALTSAAVMYCVDGDSGKVNWQSKQLGKPHHKHNRSSSALVVDGLVVVGTDTGCHALDVKTGEERWHNAEAGDKEASPVAWRVDGARRILSIGNSTGKHRLYALDATDGKVLWWIPPAEETHADWRGDFRSSPTVVDDRMVFCGGKKLGLVAYALGDGPPKKLWQIKMHDAYASPIVHEGYVYYIGGGRATCVELVTGKITWQKRLSGRARLSSPVLADGKLFAIAAPTLLVIKAEAKEYTPLARAKFNVPKWSSPVIADGRLYLRIGKCVTCYDLRKP